MEDILAITLLFGGGTAFLLAISPVGRAIAERIKRGGKGGPDAVTEQLQEAQLALLDELDAVRQELTDVQERLDFAERILVKQRETGQLPKGEGVKQ
jgi:hypothetical protein